MPEVKNENGNFLTISQGQLRKKVTPETPGAIKREYELKTGEKGTKFELVYKNWQGKVTFLKIKETPYGETLNIYFTDAVISMPVKSRYFSSFVRAFAGSNREEEITLTPYDFETDDGKKMTGVSLKQNNEKVKDYFFDKTTKKSINGMPEPGEIKDKDDWKIYFLQVDKFLKKWVNDNYSTLDKAISDDNDEINVYDIPF